MRNISEERRLNVTEFITISIHMAEFVIVSVNMTEFTWYR